MSAKAREAENALIDYGREPKDITFLPDKSKLLSQEELIELAERLGIDKNLCVGHGELTEAQYIEAAHTLRNSFIPLIDNAKTYSPVPSIDKKLGDAAGVPNGSAYRILDRGNTEYRGDIKNDQDGNTREFSIHITFDAIRRGQRKYRDGTLFLNTDARWPHDNGIIYIEGRTKKGAYQENTKAALRSALQVYAAVERAAQPRGRFSR